MLNEIKMNEKIKIDIVFYFISMYVLGTGEP